jgi:hypothetical protein
MVYTDFAAAMLLVWCCQVDKLKAKLIAGRIIPAIATATALATGMVCLELYKVCRHITNTRQHHNGLLDHVDI